MPDEPLNNDQIDPSNPPPINTTVSEPSNMPSEAPESSKNADIPVSLNNPSSSEALVGEANPENIPLEPTDTPSANPASNETGPQESEPISEPAQTPEPRTAQMAGNEPLDSTSEPLTPESQTQPAEATPPPVIQTSRNRVLELLNKAKLAIQFRKRKKLDKIMSLFLQKSKITNDEVEKFLHVSDATAERYLNILEKENKIKQVGKTGKAVSYSRI